MVSQSPRFSIRMENLRMDVGNVNKDVKRIRKWNKDGVLWQLLGCV